MESVADDGKFIMPLEDYIQNYNNTTFTIESNASIYKHNPVAFNLIMQNKRYSNLNLKRRLTATKKGSPSLAPSKEKDLAFSEVALSQRDTI